MIECHHVTQEYSRGFWQKKRHRVLSDLSFSLRRGETYALCGMSGAGKSTVGRVLLGLLPVTSGDVLYDGRSLREMLRSPAERKAFRCENQMLFQNPQAALYGDFPVRRLLEEPYRIHAARLGAVDWDHILASLRRVRLDEEILDRYPAQLSGGQLQRLFLARILLLQPSFLVLDEPTAMLDPTAQEDVMRLLKELQQTEGLTYLFISHHLGLVRYLADTVGVLKDGGIIEEGSAKDILAHPKTPFVRDFVRQFSA
ncbi:MAG: ABC transporter ATP-binding protein [Schwartzia sp. (in: firmicutes)]